VKAAQVVALSEPLEIVDVPDPEPGPRDVVLRVHAEGICRSDWHLWVGDFVWLGASMALPRILGHELAGEVVAVGSDVATLAVGDRAMATFHLGCGHCRHCATGHTNICENLHALGNTVDGGYAEYVRVLNADLNCVQLPEAVDAVSAAAIGCRYMTAFSGVTRRGQMQPGEWVLVNGVGGVGLSAVQIAATLGGQVIAVDVDDAKLGQAMAEGAVATINARTTDVPQAVKEMTSGGADLSIDALGITETAVSSIMSLRKDGRHVQLGVTTQAERGLVPIPLDLLVVTELSIIGSHGNPVTDLRRLLTLVERGVLDPKKLVTRKLALEEAGGVLASMGQYGTAGFNVITSF